MEIKTWFGNVGRGSCALTGDAKGMISELLASKSSGTESQPDLRALARSCGIDDGQYDILLREVAIGLVRLELQSLTTAEEDLLQMVEALDDLNNSINLLDERLYEWSRLYKEEVIHGKDLAEAFLDKGGIGELAHTLLYLRESRNRLENQVAGLAEELSPNLSLIAGPLLAARLISRAGSLKRLSEMPSSTIQVMGAEKSLFKHLKGKAPSPKHGTIFRHPAVSGAPRSLRGRAARALAGKLAIAARLDYYGGEKSPEIKESLDKRLAEIRRSKIKPKPRSGQKSKIESKPRSKSKSKPRLDPESKPKPKSGSQSGLESKSSQGSSNGPL
jgi:nucleolar protein 56